MAEFLSRAFGDERVKRLPALRVSRLTLNYPDNIIADPMPAGALNRPGVQVRLPRLDGFAIRDLIVADLR